MKPDDRLDPPPRTRQILVAVAVTACVIAFLVLHLTGVLGPGSH